MSDRIPCCVPFCRRTIARLKLPEGIRESEGAEWICARHWKVVPRSLRRRKWQSEKLEDRADLRFRAAYHSQGGYTEAQLERAIAACRLRAAIWRRCKEAAITSAVFA